MPITPTYPGVYIEEISSGVRTIVGVATSITAFVGFAPKGPVNEPVRIQNFGDYERRFGGLDITSTMSYAVQQFFLNGGADALIVRLSNPGVKAKVELDAGSSKLILEALTGGTEGNDLKVSVNHDSVTDSNHFNLVLKKKNDTLATINDIKVDEVVDKIKNDEAARQQIQVSGEAPAERPAVIANKKFEGGEKGGAQATINLPISKNIRGENITNKFLILKASSEGSWGNNLQAIVDYDTEPKNNKTFNLTVQYVEDNQVTGEEKLRNLSIDSTSQRYVAEVLNNLSTFVRVDKNPDLPGKPDATTVDGTGKPQPQTAVANSGDDGEPPTDDSFYIGNESKKTGIYALEKADLFNLLCIPPVSRTIDIQPETWSKALTYCVQRRAMLIVDPPSDWDSIDDVKSNLSSFLNGWTDKKNAAIFFPRIKLADPLKENRLEVFAPCGAIAGVFARTDAQRGVWKAPAGVEATLTGVRELSVKLTDGENGQLNPLGVNCLRSFPVYGNVVWGTRTLDGDDRIASESKYESVRRTTLFIEESLYRGTQWVVFEPNDEPLWAQIRLNVGAFMNNLFRQGAFQGTTPREAYLVKCDKETTTQNDRNLGIVNIVVGFLPLKPAEFVIIKIQQLAGQIAI